MNPTSSVLKFEGLSDRAAHFLRAEHLSSPALWAKFVDVYRTQPDGENSGWRGEYFGKMMRGAALVCKYTKSESLYGILTDSVRDMLTVIEDDGRVSSYTRESELDGWDIWGRKYVMLALEYYLDICEDEALRTDIISFLCRCADYILCHIGEGKLKITRASHYWRGLNSSSVLEPMVRLYKLTGEKRYLDFSAYIVSTGAAEGIDVFSLAYENRLYPYQYGVSKAYELTSCFEGLLEYYEVTGIEKYRRSVVNYARALLDSEMSIIGSSGMTHELFDHTRTRETISYPEDGVMQETCVTVTLMKFFCRVALLTDDTRFTDAVEKSFYNAYLGALNTEHKESLYAKKAINEWGAISTDLPFDSYSPLTPDRRGKMTGGFQILPDHTYYGCCACIGAAGVGVFLENAIIFDGSTVTVNFYERGRFEFVCADTAVCIEIDTEYPASGEISLHVGSEKPVFFRLRLRSPAWSGAPRGYAVYEKEWKDDRIDLCFDMPIRVHYPEYMEEDTVYTDMSKRVDGYRTASAVKVQHKTGEEKYVAFTKGPLTLAADDRLGKAADSVFYPSERYTACESILTDGVPCVIKVRIEKEGEEPFYLVDYASAGRDWNTRIAAWLPII